MKAGGYTRWPSQVLSTTNLWTFLILPDLMPFSARSSMKAPHCQRSTGNVASMALLLWGQPHSAWKTRHKGSKSVDCLLFHSEIFLSHCMCTLLPGFPILYQLVLLVGNHILKCGSIAFLLFHVLMHSFFQQMFIGCLIRQALLHTMDSKMSLSCGANSGGKVSIHPKTHTMYNHRLEQWSWREGAPIQVNLSLQTLTVPVCVIVKLTRKGEL